MKCVMLMVYVCVSSPFCSCKDAVRYLNESSPTEADRSIGANQTSFPCFSELHLLSRHIASVTQATKLTILYLKSAPGSDPDVY